MYTSPEAVWKMDNGKIQVTVCLKLGDRIGGAGRGKAGK